LSILARRSPLQASTGDGPNRALRAFPNERTAVLVQWAWMPR
jgi:hypothetical protein